MRSIKFADLGRHPQPLPLTARPAAASPAPEVPASGSTIPVPVVAPAKQPGT